MPDRQTAAELLVAARARYQRLTPAQALEAVRAGALLVDTRSADARRRDGIIPDARHIPLSVLPWRLDPSSPFRDRALTDGTPDSVLARQVIVFCDHGFSSSLATGWLLDLGYRDATDIDGGFEAWQSAGLPVEMDATEG
jgi:rhodanese-related sulfurtransferase